MLVAVDIGNTHVHLGLFDLESGRLVNHFTSSVTDTPLEGLSVDPSILQDASDCILASVNPEVEDAFCDWLKTSMWKSAPLRVPADVPLNIPVLTKKPEKTGVDRLLNAMAAFKRTGTSTVVVDAGTAITIDVISKKGEFLGGVITPGLTPLTEALHTQTALLPRVSVQRPRHTLGKDTDEAVNSGIYWGMVGAIEKIMKNLLEELGDDPVVLATGGDAKLLATEIQTITGVVPHLTLEGLLVAYTQHLNSKEI